MRKRTKRPANGRFLEKVKIMETGCHEWQSTMHRSGYGVFWFNGIAEKAHRAAWMIFKGEVPKDRWVLHHCDNRKCVNTDHLYLGTPKDNVRDTTQRKGWHGNTKIPFEKVLEAREMVANGCKHVDAARATGININTISAIINKRTRVLN